MNRRLSQASGLLMCAVLAAHVAFAQEFTKDDMDLLVKRLDEAAAAWVNDQPVPIGLDARLKGIDCNDKTVGLFADALGAGRKDPNRLFVANKLVLPFLMAKAQPIAQIIPAVVQVYSGAGGYQEFPQYTPQQLKEYQMPQPPPSSQAAAGIRRLQETKIARERPIAQHNQQLYQLEVNTGRLLLYAETADCDQQLIDLVTRTEEKGLYAYADLLVYIREEAEKMDQARARKYYDAFVKLGNDLRLMKKKYRKPAESKLLPDANSTMGSVDDYPGIRLLEAVNVLATVAKMPAYKVPTPQEIDRKTPGPRPRPRPTRPPRPTGGG